MNKVITVNLNGAAYQVEEAGYDALRAYLDSASRRLDANPDRAEIIADIEQAIADKFRALLTAHKNVITTAEVSRIVTEMGPVEDSSASSLPEMGGAAATAEPASATGASSPPSGVKRFYRLQEGAMFAGVCNGAAAYLNVDATVMRAIYVAVWLVFFFIPYKAPFFFWAAIYAALAIIVPKAETPAEQAAAHGGHDAPHTAQEFIRRAKAGYYEGMKTWHDRDARREWKRKFKQDMRGWKHNFEREMRRQGDQIGGYWHQHWGVPAISAAAWIVLPIVSLLQIVLIGLWIMAIFSLVNTGTAFGHPMLATMPFWKALVVLAVVYFLLSLPLRALRHAVLGRGYRSNHYAHPAAGISYALVGICNTVVWVGAFAVATWLFVHHPTEVGRVFGELFAAVRQAVDAVAARIADRR